MVFEDTFDNLVKEIGSHEFVDVRIRKFICEWLKLSRNMSLIPSNKYEMSDTILTSTSPTRP